MKMKNAGLAAVAAVIAAVSFSGGYFAGRARGAEVSVTVENRVYEYDPGSGQEDGRVNINTAGRQMLMTVPGIGETLADRILAYREENGPFTAPAQIMEVPGIGQALYEKIADGITVGQFREVTK